MDFLSRSNLFCTTLRNNSLIELAYIFYCRFKNKENEWRFEKSELSTVFFCRKAWNKCIKLVYFKVFFDLDIWFLWLYRRLSNTRYIKFIFSSGASSSFCVDWSCWLLDFPLRFDVSLFLSFVFVFFKVFFEFSLPNSFSISNKTVNFSQRDTSARSDLSAF